MNKLANSTSPYLLQHANNPVNWYPWGAEALQKAKDENKLIIVSIGYSACHWCHVMEHESFEDESVAAVMNEYFVCIKVDREERPDVDQIYMTAVQLMSGRGGWPLNCILLPDQRPIYGGTYYRKQDWTSILFNLADLYKNKPEEAEEYAVRLTDGIERYETLDRIEEQPEYTKADLERIVSSWKKHIDRVEGGLGRAPKFPMSNNWISLTRYAHLAGDEDIASAVQLTLQKMANGGIYDHVGGGFARYSVDGLWHVPHFEKMLYDNAQLISLYAEACIWKPELPYKMLVAELIYFVARELRSPQGGFYSALDADSDGVEGKFYTWTKEEIVALAGEDAEAFCAYYHVTDEGNWPEEETNVLFKRDDDYNLAATLGMDVYELRSKASSARFKLFEARSQRVRPGLDDKILASWNGLMLKALCDAYKAFNAPYYLELALINAKFIAENLIDENGRLQRIYKTSGSTAPDVAFLDDYANVVSAFIALYEVTFNEEWLNKARMLTDRALLHFYNEADGIFFYTADDDEQLIARKSELMDSVIPASNSVMARNLKQLGLFFDEEEYLAISAQMLRNTFSFIEKYGSAYSNWFMLLLDEVFGVYEVAITGESWDALRAEMEKKYIPNKIMLGGKAGSLPLLQGKFGQTTQIFVCKDRTCGLPVIDIAGALKQISN